MKDPHRPLACLLLLLVAGASTGFRPFNNAAEQIVEEFEASFQARNQIEYYEIIRVTEDNRIDRGGMLIIYEYGDDGVRGLWRIMDAPGFNIRAATLLCIQKNNAFPELFLYDEASSIAGAIEGGSRRQNLSATDWHLEDIYDNDKEVGREFLRDGNTVLQGEYVFKVRSRYRDLVMREASAYGDSVAYFTVADKRFMRLEIFDKSNRLLKTINPENPINLGDAETPRYRPRIISIVHHRQGTRTLLVLKRAAYDLDPPEPLFTPGFADSWDAARDREFVEKLTPIGDF